MFGKTDICLNNAISSPTKVAHFTISALAVFPYLHPNTHRTIHSDFLWLIRSESATASMMSSLVLIYRRCRTLRNQTHVILESRQLLAEGRCTFWSKCTKFITVTFSILGHMIYSVVFMSPNYNLCLFLILQKLPLELSVLIKYQLFKLLYIFINTSLWRVT